MEELRHLVEVMAKALVDKPEVVQVTAIEGEQNHGYRACRCQGRSRENHR